jgi:hypothetical protein
MSTRQKRRQYSRAEVDWPVFLLTPSRIVKGETRNISPGGAFIHALTDPVQDDIFRLIITPPPMRDTWWLPRKLPGKVSTRG